MSESTRMMLGLIPGIVIMVILVSKTKVHKFIALLIAGIIGGMPLVDVTQEDGTKITGLVTAIQDGFGNTLKSTGIIIGLGVMMGGILEKSGAAERVAYSFIKAVGKKKEEWALAITGWFIAIPVFADSAIVIFAPLCKAIFKVTGKSLIGLALAMAAGLQLTHCLVPPTPGPTTAATMLGTDVGQMIIFGSLISIPMLIIAVLYCQWLGKSTGIIMLITGAGGSLGNVIKVSGIGDALGETVMALPLPAILIPFIIAALMRIALGSATVAITTAASLSASLMGVISVSPLLMAISCCVGAISF